LPLESSHANDQFVGNLVDLHVLTACERQLLLELIASVAFDQFEGLAGEEPLQRVPGAVDFRGQSLDALIPEDFAPEKVRGKDGHRVEVVLGFLEITLLVFGPCPEIVVAVTSSGKSRFMMTVRCPISAALMPVAAATLVLPKPPLAGKKDDSRGFHRSVPDLL
jgi:hypothetical protein